MAHSVEPLPLWQLEARYRASHDATQARHLQAIWLLARGRSVLKVAQVLAFVPRWVEQLGARYNASGPEALGDQRRRIGRRASLLTPELLAALAGRLQRPPEDGRVWSGPQGRGLDGAAPRPGGGASAARLGCAATARLGSQRPRSPPRIRASIRGWKPSWRFAANECGRGTSSVFRPARSGSSRASGPDPRNRASGNAGCQGTRPAPPPPHPPFGQATQYSTATLAPNKS